MLQPMWIYRKSPYQFLLQSPNDMHLPADRAVQWNYHWDLKTVGTPTGHMSPYCNGVLSNPNLYLDQPITKGDASQLEVMSRTPLTVILPTDYDCLAV